MNELTKIKEVSNLFNVTTRTLRFYEKMGLIKSTRDESSGYRLYDETALARLRQILILRKMNISIGDIGKIFASHNSYTVLSVLDKKVDDIDNDIALLYELKELILEFIQQMRKIDFHNEADVKTLFDKAVEIESSLTTEKPDLTRLLDTSAHIDEMITTIAIEEKPDPYPPKLISLKTEQCGPFRFIGKSVLARGHNQRGTAALFRSNWHNSAWVFEELDKLKKHASDEPHNSALMTWEWYNEEKGQLKTYTVGRFMKPETPVPDEMDFFDIPKMVVAKGWARNHAASPKGDKRGDNALGEYFGDTLGEGLFWDEIERQGRHRAAIWKFTAEVYPEVPSDDYTFGYYVGCETTPISYDLKPYIGKQITIKFSAEVKRTNAVGDLTWQINDNDKYPVVGEVIPNAASDVWHKMNGEWTGQFTNNDPFLYVQTWGTDVDVAEYEIRNFSMDVTGQN
ncbi:MAG: MerR family transcriptional regulator [Defluviitaleaceae bacterium]|nr:MerR family transcriptional regulator [Defluviitaleaceae bacterium]